MCQRILAAHVRFLSSIAPSLLVFTFGLRRSPPLATEHVAPSIEHKVPPGDCPIRPRNGIFSKVGLILACPGFNLARVAIVQDGRLRQDRNWTSISIRGQGSTCCLLWAACNQGLSPSEKVPQAILWIRLIGAFPIRRPKSLALQFGRRLGRPVLGGPVHFIPGLRSVRQRQAFWQRT